MKSFDDPSVCIVMIDDVIGYLGLWVFFIYSNTGCVKWVCEN